MGGPRAPYSLFRVPEAEPPLSALQLLQSNKKLWGNPRTLSQPQQRLRLPEICCPRLTRVAGFAVQEPPESSLCNCLFLFLFFIQTSPMFDSRENNLILFGGVDRSIVYAACLEGSDPIRLFEKRLNARRGTNSLPSFPIWKNCSFLEGYLTIFVDICILSEPGYEFDKASLLSYNHMSFGGPAVTVDTIEEADQLLRDNEKESAIGNPVKDFLFILLNFTWPSLMLKLWHSGF